MEFSLEHFRYFQNFAKEHCGVFISNEKQYLIKGRLSDLMRKYEYASCDRLVEASKRGETINIEIVDALTTHETLFFRDIKFFDYFRNTILPSLAASESNNINILSLACSSGQEVYSIAILLEELKAKLNGKTFRIMASDVSKNTVEKASKGIYNQFEVQRGLPSLYLLKYFTQQGKEWHINSTIKDKVLFQVDNLLNFSSIVKFDCVLCRNVLIYFDNENKIKAVHNIHRYMRKNSSLILGSSETKNICPELFDQNDEMKSIFIKK